MTQNAPASRVWLLDEVRGLATLLMVFYHALYDLDSLFAIPINLLDTGFFQFFRHFFASWFMVISGIACRYSRSNLRRGGLCLGIALTLTAVTVIFLPSQQILFGILHFLGSAMLLFTLLSPLLDRIPPLAGVIGCVLLYFPFSHLDQGGIGIPGLWFFSLPRRLYTVGFLFPLGFVPPGFYSADYYPLLPGIFFFLAGSYLGLYFRRQLVPSWVYCPHNNFLAWAGRHSLWIYLAHQPVLWVALTILQLL